MAKKIPWIHNSENFGPIQLSIKPQKLQPGSSIVKLVAGSGYHTITTLNRHGDTVIFIEFTTHPGLKINKNHFDGKSVYDCCKDLFIPLSNQIAGNDRLYLTINALPLPIFLKHVIFTPYYPNTNALLSAKGPLEFPNAYEHLDTKRPLEFPTEHPYKDMLPEKPNVSNYTYGQFIEYFPATQLHTLPSVLKANIDKEVVIRYADINGKGACESVILGDVADPKWNHLIDSEAFSGIEFLDHLHSLGGDTKNHKGLININSKIIDSDILFKEHEDLLIKDRPHNTDFE